jgi:SWI/SNF-related matrix-associated actin-dependent regulator of chromatin subfamily D
MSAGPGHHQVPMTQAQVAQQQQQAAMQVEMAKRRSKKPTDKNLPDAIDDCTIGDVAKRYREQRDFERRLDATMTRKRLDIVDSVNRSVKVRPLFANWLSFNVLTCLELAPQDSTYLGHEHYRGSSLAVKRSKQ